MVPVTAPPETECPQVVQGAQQVVSEKFVGWVHGNIAGERSHSHYSTERPLLAGLKKIMTIILGADDETLGGRFNELLLGGLRMTDNADDDGEDIASRRL